MRDPEMSEVATSGDRVTDVQSVSADEDDRIAINRSQSPPPCFADDGWASVVEGLTLVTLATLVFVPSELGDILIPGLREAGVWEIALRSPVVRTVFVITSFMSGILLLAGRFIALGIPRKTGLRVFASTSCLLLTYHLLCTASLALHWPLWPRSSVVFVAVSSRLAQSIAEICFLIFVAGIARCTGRRDLKEGTNQLIAFGAGIVAAAPLLEMAKAQLPGILVVFALAAALACGWWLRWYLQFLAKLIAVVDNDHASATKVDARR